MNRKPPPTREEEIAATPALDSRWRLLTAESWDGQKDVWLFRELAYKDYGRVNAYAHHTTAKALEWGFTHWQPLMQPSIYVVSPDDLEQATGAL